MEKHVSCLQNCLKSSEKEVAFLQNYLKRKVICIRSHRQEIVIDLCCNMGYSLLRRGILAD